MPARSASPSRSRIAAIRVLERVEVGRLGLEDGLDVAVGARRPGRAIGRGTAATATTSSAATIPASRSRSLARIASRSASRNRSFLFRTTIDRFPCRASAASGSILGADQVVIDDEQEQVGPRGQVAGLGSRGPAPPSPISERPGRVGQQDRPVDPLDVVGVVLALPGRAHDGLGLADVLAEQGVDQRGLARRAGAEDDDVEPPRWRSARSAASSVSSRVRASSSLTWVMTPSAFSAWISAARTTSSGALTGGRSARPQLPEEPSGGQRRDNTPRGRRRRGRPAPAPANAWPIDRASRRPKRRARPPPRTRRLPTGVPIAIETVGMRYESQVPRSKSRRLFRSFASNPDRL